MFDEMTVAELDIPNPSSIDSYLNFIYSQPQLSAEEELALSRKFKNEDDLASAEKLILSHLRLVAYIAKQYKGYNLPFYDLLQEGTVGLMKAVKTFDPEKGFRLSTHAMLHIKSNILEFIVRNWSIVKTVTTNAKRKLFFNLRKMNHLSHNRIAEELNVTESETIEMASFFKNMPMSFNRDTTVEHDEFAFAPEDYLKDMTYEPTNVIQKKNKQTLLTSGIETAMESLDERSKFIITQRYMIDEPLTLKELAAQLNVSSQRVGQIEVVALAKIKNNIPKHLADSFTD